MASLKEKVALITGASSGIGAGTAVHFASLGCHLAICGRNLEALRNTASQCQQAGLPQDKVLVVQGDLSLDDDCHAVVRKTVEYYGHLDVLVNSAGILKPGTIEDMTMEDYDMSMNINVRSLVLLCKLVIPYLLKTKGNIVNVSSITGMRAFPGVLAYNMSKAAVDQLTRTVSLELASKGVRVNSVNPGVVVTEVHKRGGMSDEQYEKFLEHSKSTHPLGRVGTVQEVAKCVAFLASDDSSFCTGVTLPVDGGRSNTCLR